MNDLRPDTFVRRAARGTVAAVALAFIATDLRLTEALSIQVQRSILAVIVVAAGVVLAALRLRVVVNTALVLVGLLWLAVAWTPLVPELAAGMPRVDSLAPADCVYVLASEVQVDGDPSPEAMMRLIHGVELVGQKLAPRLVVGELGAPRVGYLAAARHLVESLKLETEVLAIGPVANTRDEGQLLGELMRKNGWSKLIIVTSPLHSRRAAAVFEAQGLTVISSPTREAKYDLDGLDSADDRVRAFPDLVHERVGLWVYRRRGIIH